MTPGSKVLFKPEPDPVARKFSRERAIGLVSEVKAKGKTLLIAYDGQTYTRPENECVAVGHVLDAG